MNERHIKYVSFFIIFKKINNMQNSILDGGEWFGKPLKLCGYSFSGFIEDLEERKIADEQFKYIRKNCKHWSYFGDGLCFACDCEEAICPFDKILKNYESQKAED